jgi:ribosomal protein S18 acetylase RimI-like enzyme
MYQYTATTEPGRDDAGTTSPPPEFDLGVFAPNDLPDDTGSVHRDGNPFAELISDEHIVAAVSGDDVAGYLFVSVDATHHIHPLETEVSFDGGYIRRLYVDPRYRQRGLATILVQRACDHVAADGAEQVHALVALDNRPSQWVFEANGFERTQKHSYVYVFGHSRRSVELLR